MLPETIEAISQVMGHQFNQDNDLESCFTSPHRSDKDGPDSQTDGNRVWSNMGQTVIHLVGDHQRLLVPKGPYSNIQHDSESRRVANEYTSWALSADTRAARCKHLGLDRYVKRSPRQQHLEPSAKILGNVMSAIIGVIWNDHVQRGATVSVAVREILLTLQRIGLQDHKSADTASPSLAMIAVTNADESSTAIHDFSTPSPPYPGFHTPLVDDIEWPYEFMDLDSAGDPSNLEMYPTIGPNIMDLDVNFYVAGQALDTGESLPENVCTREEEPSACSPIEIGSTIRNDLSRITAPSVNVEVPRGDTSPSATASTAGVPKKAGSSGKVYEKVQDEVVQQLIGEEWSRHGTLSKPESHSLRIFVESSDILKLAPTKDLVVWRLLWYAIGSNQTLVGLIRAFNEAGTHDVFNSDGSHLIGSPEYHLKMVVRMQQKTALSALLARCHLMKAFMAASEIFQDCFHTTQTGFIQGRRSAPGNPINKAESEVIDTLVRALGGEVGVGTLEDRKKRRFAKELSRAGKRLRIFIDAFGFGILALVPYTNMDPDMNIDDKLLAELDIDKLKGFVNHLQQQQGEHLHSLCKLVEPVLETLICGQTKNCHINLPELDAIVGLPKGSPEVLLVLQGTAAQ